MNLSRTGFVTPAASAPRVAGSVRGHLITAAIFALVGTVAHVLHHGCMG